MEEIYEGKVEEVDNLGNGIIRLNNMVVFIKGCFKDEEILYKIERKEKRFMKGTLFKVIKGSPKRKTLPCKYFYNCGGCNMLHLLKDEELLYKTNYIKDLFKEYKVNDIVTVNEYNYRNKVTLHVKNGTLGYFMEHTNTLIEIDKCLLLENKINDVIKYLKTVAVKEVTKIIIKKSNYDDKIMLIIFGSIDKNTLENIVLNKNIDTLYINDTLIKGEKYIKEVVFDKVYLVGPNSFFQVNTYVTEKLYNFIKEEVKTSKKLLDLYCGVGSISIFLHENLENVKGVEIVKEAIMLANKNKDINKAYNCKFLCGDSKIIKNEYYDTVIVDPPRSGLSKDVITNINNMHINKMIYVSCNPKTLKRDIITLNKTYDIISITPFNMFPKTCDVECVCIMKLKK